MSNNAYRTILGILLFGLAVAGCNPSQEPPPSQIGTTPPPSPQSIPSPPPQPYGPTLFMIPLSPNDFSMQAIQTSKNRIEENPEDVQALVHLGHANLMIQRFEVSQGYYERALSANPKHIDARLSLSNCYLFLQKPDEAIRQLDALLSFQKDYPEALYNKGLILLKSNLDSMGAKQSWMQLVQSHPEHALAQEVKDELERL